MPILELNDQDETPTAGSGVGSVAAGGRYDNLVNMFDKRSNVPCVGLSIGVERLFAVMQAKLKAGNQKVKTVDTQVYVVTAQKGLVSERLKLCQELWSGKIRVSFLTKKRIFVKLFLMFFFCQTECSYKANPKALDQFQYCEEQSIPFCVIVGDDEIKNNIVTLKNVVTRDQEKLSRETLVEELSKRLAEL
jgi:histidyl-tRNA synthetase